MRSRVILTLSLVAFLAALSPLGAETLQQKYLDIYLKINDAEHLEKQGDFVGALDDFKDCYTGLQQIHDDNPDWEAALVVHRMADCQAKILELQPKADTQVEQQQAAAAAAAAAQLAQPTNASPAAPTIPPPGPNETAAANTGAPSATTPVPPAPTAGDSDEVASLKLQLQAVKEELRITKENLKESQAQLETYRVQLQTVNEQLEALKNQPSENDRMGKLMSENKTLNDKLADAEKELESLKSSPSSKLALAQAQLKNLQDEYDESQAANKALQDTTTTLKGQLDQAQADLVAANQKLASMNAASSDYATLKHENEMMREILTRELQEQAHRDMAKRLAQEEFDNLKLKSKVLQEQLDILGSPMTPPSDDEEKAFLESLKVSAPDVTDSTGNSFSAPASGTPTAPPPAAPDTNSAASNPPSPSTPAPAAANTASAAPPSTTTAAASAAPATNTATTAPSTPAAPASTDTPPGQPPVTIVMNGDGSTPPAQSTPPATTTPSATSSAPAPTAPTSAGGSSNSTPTDPTVPVPPTGTPLGNSANTAPPSTTSSAPPSDPNAPTKSTIPPAQTTVNTTTVTHGDATNSQQNADDPTQYSTKARLPDDMKETAQEAADLFKNQNYDASAAKYQSIIDKYPESLYAWSNLGVVRFQQGKFDDALKALQQAVKLSPTDAFSYSNLGIVYYQLGQYENAIDALNSAKALDPDDAKTHNYLGCACSQKGWNEVAEKEFRKAIEIDPNFGDAHFNLALVYATQKPPSLELARREYNTALSLGIARDARLEKLLGNPAGGDSTSVGQSVPGQ